MIEIHKCLRHIPTNDECDDVEQDYERQRGQYETGVFQKGYAYRTERIKVLFYKTY